MIDWWTSNYRPAGNAIMNTSMFAGDEKPRLSKSLSFDNFMNHRLSIESVYPVFDYFGNLVMTAPYRLPDGTDSFTGKSKYKWNDTAGFTDRQGNFVQVPPISGKSYPKTQNWSVMDIIYEMYEIVDSSNEMCEYYPQMKKDFEYILAGFGIAPLDHNVFAANVADYTANGLNPNFSISIVRDAMEVIKNTIAEIDSKVQQCKSIVSGW
jgi:hypothetical protein